VTDDATNISDAAKELTLDQCLERGAEENAKGKAEAKSADDARLRAMTHNRNSGDWYIAANAKADEEGKPWGEVLKAHCEARGESERTAYENIRIAKHWGRAEEYALRNNADHPDRPIPLIPTSKPAFWDRLEQMDGKRDAGGGKEPAPATKEPKKPGKRTKPKPKPKAEELPKPKDEPAPTNAEDGASSATDEPTDEEPAPGVLPGPYPPEPEDGDEQETKFVKQLRYWWVASTDQDRMAFAFEFDREVERILNMVPENKGGLSFAEAVKQGKIAA
jgi:hypothetical protein